MNSSNNPQAPAAAQQPDALKNQARTVLMLQDSFRRMALGLIALIGLMAILAISFEQEMADLSAWVIQQLGFWGLALIILVTDSIVTPFPPDIILVFLAKSPLSDQWPLYVGILGAVSATAGMIGYGIGQFLAQNPRVAAIFGLDAIKERYQEPLQRYGFWAIALGAITPLPYSLTCWTAGALNFSWFQVLMASILFRIPRFFLYYWIITATTRIATGNVF